MNIIFVLVAGLPIGYFVRKRGMAVIAFLIADSFLFTYQTLTVLLNWMSGEKGVGGAKAFGEFPTTMPIVYSDADLLGYGLVNLGLVVVGVALTLLGNWVRGRFGRRRDAALPAAD